MGAKITVKQDGQTRTVTRLEAALHHLVAKATAGDTSAFRLISGLMQAYFGPPEPSPRSASELEEAERKVLEGLSALFSSEGESED